MIDSSNDDKLCTLDKYSSITLAERIKDTAYSKNIAVKPMLKELNISINFIQQMSHDNRQPRIEAIARIADYLQVSVDYLLHRTDIPQGTTDSNTREQPSTVAQAVEIIANKMQVSTDYIIGKLGLPPDFCKHDTSK